jgi:hypothetical protein
VEILGEAVEDLFQRRGPLPAGLSTTLFPQPLLPCRAFDIAYKVSSISAIEEGEREKRKKGRSMYG